jgi:hypothetical protein
MSIIKSFSVLCKNFSPFAQAPLSIDAGQPGVKDYSLTSSCFPFGSGISPALTTCGQKGSLFLKMR